MYLKDAVFLDELTNLIGDVEHLKDTGKITKFDAKDVKHYITQVLTEAIQTCTNNNAYSCAIHFIVAYRCHSDSNCTSGYCVDGWCNSAFDHGKESKTCLSSFMLI